MLGPRAIAQTSIKVGEPVTGYLVLEPAHEVPHNGCPLLEVKVRFSKATLNSEMPGEGNTDILTEVFGGQGVGAFEPSAPQAFHGLDGNPSVVGEPVPEPEVLGKMMTLIEEIGDAQVVIDRMQQNMDVKERVEASGCQGDLGASQPQPNQTQPQQQEAASGASGGLGESLGSSSTTTGRPSGSNSIFFIDPEVYMFSPLKEWNQRLKDLSDKGLRQPFPSSPGRNFNVLGAAWDEATGDYVEGVFWQTESQKPLCEHIGDVYAQFCKFALKENHRHGCQGVRVIQAFLKHTED